MARFQSREVVNVQPGAETAFAVSVAADYYGQKGDLEGLDKLEVERWERQ